MALLTDRFDIIAEQPLPQFDGPLARAYAARSKSGQQAAKLFALIAHGHHAVRADVISSQRGLIHTGMMRVREGGLVDWSLTGQRHFAFIYEVPEGQRLMAPGATSFTPVKETVFLERFAPALCGALNEMALTGIVHGSIRPDNIYVSGQSEGGGAVLGDNLAQPPGLGQGALYDTIERALAPELGRGPGSSADDYYALGVTLLVALTGQVPLQGLEAQAIVQMKMERGTYAALAGERRFPAAIIELLRGLTSDDSKARWGHEDVGHWLSGRRLTPKPTFLARRASRALRFGALDVTHLRQLMQAFTQDTRLAATLINNDELSRWLTNGLSDDTLVKYLDEAKQTARLQRFGPEEERLVANVICALDSGGPIRYRGVAVMPAGLPTLLAEMLVTGGNVQMLCEIIQNDLPEIWHSYQRDKRPEMIAGVQLAEKAKPTLQGTATGFGPERALYEMAPLQPCLSPLVAGRYALNMRALMEALDRRAGQGPMGFMDRHLGAFILSRDRKVLPQMLASIEQTGDGIRRNVAILSLYSDLQYRHGPDTVKNLATLMLPLVEDTARRFHNRARQDKVRKDLRAAAQAGVLSKMLDLVDNPAALAEDAEQFEAARVLYAATEEEMQRLSLYATNKKALAAGAGQPLAAAISVLLAFVVLVVVVLRLFV